MNLWSLTFGATALLVVLVAASMNAWLVAAIVLASAATALVVSGLLRRAGARRLALWAAQVGWVHTASDPWLVQLSTRFPFGRGDEPQALEVLEGRFEHRRAVSFTYQFERLVRNGEGSGIPFRFHVVAIEIPAVLPTVEVVPERLVSRMEEALGAQDLRFESEEFNRTFRVRADDERTARAILHPRLMTRLLQPGARDVAWRIEGAWIVSWRPGPTRIRTLAHRLAVLSAVADEIPRHVWLDHGYDPQQARTGRREKQR